MIVKRKEVYM